MYFEEINVG